PVEMISILPVDAISGGVTLTGMERMTPVNFVTSDWFRTFGIRVNAGRDISDRDRAGTPRVALANQAFARKYLHGASPVGHTIGSSVGRPPLTLSMDIVGSVDDALYGSLREPQHPMLYLPIAQNDWLPPGFLAQIDLSVRTGDARPMDLARSVAASVRQVNPDLVVTFRSLTDQVNATLTQE